MPYITGIFSHSYFGISHLIFRKSDGRNSTLKCLHLKWF